MVLTSEVSFLKNEGFMIRQNSNLWKGSHVIFFFNKQSGMHRLKLKTHNCKIPGSNPGERSNNIGIVVGLTDSHMNLTTAIMLSQT